MKISMRGKISGVIIKMITVIQNVVEIIVKDVAIGMIIIQYVT